jgi:hypothetical protein
VWLFHPMVHSWRPHSIRSKATNPPRE